MEKFKRITHFLKEIWSGFDAVAQLQENVEKPQRPSDHAMKLLQAGVKKILKIKTLKELDEAQLPNQQTRSFDYCEEITKNKEQIKLKTLEYLENFIDMYYKVYSIRLNSSSRN